MRRLLRSIRPCVTRRQPVPRLPSASATQHPRSWDDQAPRIEMGCSASKRKWERPLAHSLPTGVFPSGCADSSPAPHMACASLHCNQCRRCLPRSCPGVAAPTAGTSGVAPGANGDTARLRMTMATSERSAAGRARAEGGGNGETAMVSETRRASSKLRRAGVHLAAWRERAMA